MIRRYCDVCGEQIDSSFAIQRIKGTAQIYGQRRHTTVAVEVMVGVGRDVNTGDICAKCVVAAVHQVAKVEQVFADEGGAAS